MQSIKKANRVLFNEILRIKQHAPYFGGAVIDWLKDNEVEVIFDRSLNVFGMCTYADGKPTLHINPENPEMFNEMIFHEGFHAIQLSTGKFHAIYNKSLEESMIDLFSMEAGAISFAAMGQYEMRLNGERNAFEVRKSYSKHERGMNEVYRGFEQSYQSAGHEITDVIERLKVAGKQTFADTFKNPVLINDYMNTYLSMFADFMNQFSMFSGLYCFDRVDPLLSGILPDGDSLSETFNKQTAMNDTYSTMAGLKDAVAWLEYNRISKNAGKFHFSKVKAAKDRLVEYNNPYRDIPYEAFETAFLGNLCQPDAKQKTIKEILDILSGDQIAHQLHFDFSKPFPSKRSNP